MSFCFLQLLLCLHCFHIIHYNLMLQPKVVMCLCKVPKYYKSLSIIYCEWISWDYTLIEFFSRQLEAQFFLKRSSICCLLWIRSFRQLLDLQMECLKTVETVSPLFFFFFFFFSIKTNSSKDDGQGTSSPAGEGDTF